MYGAPGFALPSTLDRLLRTVSVGEHGVALAAMDEQVELGRAEQATRRIGDALYRKWHAGSRRPLGEAVAPRDLADTDFMVPLARELVHRRSLSPGWRVLRRTSDGVVVEREGLRVLVDAERVHEDDAGSGLATVSMPGVRPALSPGFFIIDGESGTPDTRTGWTLRVYAHLDGARAHEAARRALAVLDPSGEPYRMKLLSAHGAYPRYDSLVVYLSEYVPASRLEELVEAFAPCLAGWDVSPFVARLGPGVGFAWEPAEQAWPPRSFGQHRAELVAGAIVDWAAGPSGAAAGIELCAVVADHLTTAGVEPGAPWREFASPPDPAVLEEEGVL
jgi:HopA1 effector protein family